MTRKVFSEKIVTEAKSGGNRFCGHLGENGSKRRKSKLKAQRRQCGRGQDREPSGQSGPPTQALWAPGMRCVRFGEDPAAGEVGTGREQGAPPDTGAVTQMRQAGVRWGAGGRRRGQRLIETLFSRADDDKVCQGGAGERQTRMRTRMLKSKSAKPFA